MILERRIRTEAPRFGALLADRPRARILLEASTESEWVARCLEALGHEVIVGDPNYAPMYAHRSRRVKTDRRDSILQGGRLDSGREPTAVWFRPTPKSIPGHKVAPGRRPLRTGGSP